jgi:uncharacterized protein (TIGR02118 family)
MYKIVSLMKRKEGMPFEEFKKWILEEHVVFARKIPGLKHFSVNVLREQNDELPYDCVNELVFDSAESRAAAMASEEGKASGADAAAHCSTRFHLPCIEKEHF